MTSQQIIIFAILVAFLVLLAWGRWRYDVLAFAALLAGVAAGVVMPEDAFEGFGHPATVTVACVLIISRTLITSGATQSLARLVRPLAHNLALFIGGFAGMGMAMSAFMNNVGALSLLMPTAIESAGQARLPIARILMPLSFGSILGGLITLIGTPPNIIVATYRGEVKEGTFAMFDFTAVGLPVALVGVAFVALVGWRLVPLRKESVRSTGDLFDIHDYVTEARVPEDCPAIGKTLVEIHRETEDIDARVIDLVRRKRHYFDPRRKELHAGDILLIEASPKEMDRFVRKFGFELRGDRRSEEESEEERENGGEIESASGANDGKSADADKKDVSEEKRKPIDEQSLMEAVVPPGSPLVDRLVGDVRWLWQGGVTLLGVSRQGYAHHGRLKSLRIQQGDVLLLSGEPDELNDTVQRIGALPLAGRDLGFQSRHGSWPVLAIFGAAIAASVAGLLPIWITLGLAVVAYVVLGFLPLRELYSGIDWPVIVLLGSLIPLGEALQTTGATQTISDFVVVTTFGLPDWVVVAALMVVTMALTDVINNAATAVIMAPIGAGIAASLGADADPFLMAVAVGASCAFLTPIGHQNNALIMGPGGYRFWDYWRMGLPLDVLVVATAVPMILIVWPL